MLPESDGNLKTHGMRTDVNECWWCSLKLPVHLHKFPSNESSTICDVSFVPG